MPGQTVSAGVCLESFVVATTDEAFVPQFVDRTGKGARHTKVCVFWVGNGKDGGTRVWRTLASFIRRPASPVNLSRCVREGGGAGLGDEQHNTRGDRMGCCFSPSPGRLPPFSRRKTACPNRSCRHTYAATVDQNVFCLALIPRFQFRAVAPHHAEPEPLVPGDPRVLFSCDIPC